MHGIIIIGKTLSKDLITTLEYVNFDFWSLGWVAEESGGDSTPNLHHYWLGRRLKFCHRPSPANSGNCSIGEGSFTVAVGSYRLQHKERECELQGVGAAG